jgi:DNA-binding NarL/FixJ family response regulator
LKPIIPVIGIYTDRELLRWALDRITEHEFKCAAIQQDGGRDVHPRLVPLHSPSAVVIDFQNGVFTLINKLLAASPNVPIVVWQRSRANEPLLNALDWGAAGVLHDNSPPADVLACLRSVTRGTPWVPDSVARAASNSRRCNLTRREEQLLRLVLQGLRNKEIAYSLRISEGTVKTYFSKLFVKLGVSDRYELALLALRHYGSDSLLPREEAGCHREYEPLNSIYIHRSVSWDGSHELSPAWAATPSNIPRL